MLKKLNRKIVLEDGNEFIGTGFGSNTDRVCELVFSTSMVGYQEAITDPSVAYQMIVMGYSVIGNYGMTDEDSESKMPTVGALVVREYNDNPSNFRYTKTLSESMEDYGIPGIEGIDTRKLIKHIRDHGSQKALITSSETPVERALEIIKNKKIPENIVEKISCKKRWYSRTSNAKYNVVVIDCGVNLTIPKLLNRLKCNVTVVPHDTPIETIEKISPDGILISNGPGNPNNVTSVIELIRNIRGKYPLFGIGLGHQLISLAYCADVIKLKYGRSGGNHAVKNLETGKLAIVAQGNEYSVLEKSLEGTGLEVTYKDCFSDMVEGIECKRDKVFSVQFHPEGSPGPDDAKEVFDKFIRLIEEEKCNG